MGLLVTDYIATAEAVGSRQLSKKMRRHLSPATIRNVMADLEELGFLSQPHTSAGRIPTEKGLRYYVDTLIEKRPLSEKEQTTIQHQYDLSDKDIPTLMRQTGRILAEVSQQAGLVLTPKWENTVFKHMEFLPLSRGRLLGIFVAQNGMVENQILEAAGDFNYRELEKINNYCNAVFVGLTLKEARTKALREVKSLNREVDRLLSQAILFSNELLQKIQPQEVVVEGESQLLGSREFSSVEQVRALMQSLEEKQGLLKILDSCLESTGVRIFIGAENPLSPSQNLSLITATYHCNHQVLGTVGVIGPTRMDYSKVIPIVDFTAKVVSDILEAQS